ncbi:MAG: TolC family protein [Pseudomonadota bacterium]
MKSYFRLITVLTLLAVLPSVAVSREITLDEAFETALKGNPSMAAAKARIERAEEAIRQARASYYPTVSLTGSATRQRLSDTSMATLPSGSSQGETYYGTGITGQWVLFSGFSTRYLEQAAALARDQTRSGLEDTRRLLLASVADAYFSAQLALQNRIIAQADRQFNQRLLTEADIKLQVGTGSLSDVLNFRIKVNAADIEMENATFQYDVARVALAALLGIREPDAKLPEPAVLVDEQAHEMETPDLSSLVETALSSRPDIRSSALGLQASRAELGAARSAYYPVLSIQGSLDADRSGGPGVDSGDISNTVSLVASYPIFEGWKTSAAVSGANAAVKEAEKNLDSLETQTVAGVRSAVSTVVTTQKQLALLKTSAELTRQTRDLVEQEYLAGSTSLVRLNEAQKEMTTSQGRLALGLVTLRQAWYSLKAQTGDL